MKKPKVSKKKPVQDKPKQADRELEIKRGPLLKRGKKNAR